MTHNRVSYGLAGWHGIAGGVTSQQDWSQWAQNNIEMQPVLPPSQQLKITPSRIRRRLDILGRNVLFACEKCLPLLRTEPAVIAVSRHGDLPSMDKIIQCARARTDISPTAFTYSVHNRFASLISMLSGYRGVNGAYSSVRDGFPLALIEATTLIAENPTLQVMIVAYESEIPKSYEEVISTSWLPHVVVFILQNVNDVAPKYSLIRHANSVSDAPDNGSCLPFVKTMLSKRTHRDGFWEYRHDG